MPKKYQYGYIGTKEDSYPIRDFYYGSSTSLEQIGEGVSQFAVLSYLGMKGWRLVAVDSRGEMIIERDILEESPLGRGSTISVDPHAID